MNFEKYNLFEECVAKMFSEEELVVSRQYRTEKNMEIDILLKRMKLNIVLRKNIRRYKIMPLGKYIPLQRNVMRKLY